MYAISRGVDKNTNAGKVKILFKHALSQACFKAKTEMESMRVDVEDIKIHNFAVNGDLTLPQTGTDISMKDWNTQEKKHIAFEPKNLETPVMEIGTEAKELTGKMYLPQELTKWTPDKYTIEQANKESKVIFQFCVKLSKMGFICGVVKKRLGDYSCLLV